MSAEPDSFGRRLAWARAVRGLSQKDVAAKAGVREHDISRWERDAARPRDHDVIVKLAIATGQTTDYLLGRTTAEGDARDGLFQEPPEDPPSAEAGRRSPTAPRRGKR